MNPPRNKSASAWGMSVAVHAALVVLLGLLLRSAPRGSGIEPDRAAGIVLARRDANEPLRYLDDPEDREAETDGAVEEAAQAALPPAAELAASALPDIAWPEPVQDFGAASNSLVPEVTLSAGGRAWDLPDQDVSEILAQEAARRSAAGPAGPSARLSLFGGAPAEGRSFVFLIDRSKSMGGAGLGALAAAQRELGKALAPLAPPQRFQIIAYHQHCVYLRNVRQLLPASDENKQAVPDYFAGLAAFGGTEHYLALQMALALKPDVVYLLTDGADPYLNESQLREIHRLAGARTSIHCIQFGFGPQQDSDSFMMRLARQNRGGYQYVRMAP